MQEHRTCSDASLMAATEVATMEAVVGDSVVVTNWLRERKREAGVEMS